MNVDNSKNTSLQAMQASLEETKSKAIQKGSVFVGNFFDLQKAGKGIDATGFCAGLAIYSYEMCSQTQRNSPPEFPESMPREVMHLQMQLPRAISLVIPKNVHPSLVKRGSNLQNDLLIQNFMESFQHLIREETNVGISQILPGPDFSNYIRPSSNKIKKLVKRLQNDGHYIFCLQKQDQLVTEGHVFYVNLNEGIISDGGFGPFIWQINQTSIALFKKIIVSYVKNNYSDWNLIVCKIHSERTSQYSKIPLEVRIARSQMSLIYNIGKKVGLLECCQLTFSLLTPNRVVQKIKNIYQKIQNIHQKKQIQRETFENNLKNLSTDFLTDSREEILKMPLEALIKLIGEDAVDTQQFNCEPVYWFHGNGNPLLQILQQNPDKVNWNNVFNVVDGLDPRINGITSKILTDLLENIFWGPFKKSAYTYLHTAKDEVETIFNTDVEDKCISLWQTILNRRNHRLRVNLKLLFDLLIIHNPKALKSIEFLLKNGAKFGKFIDESALDYACKHESPKMVSLLLKYGEVIESTLTKRLANRSDDDSENMKKIKRIIDSHSRNLTIRDWLAGFNFPCITLI